MWRVPCRTLAVGPMNIPPTGGIRLNLSVDEAAAALGVSPRTTRTLIKQKVLRAHRIGRRVLVSTEALVSFIKAREAEASS